MIENPYRMIRRRIRLSSRKLGMASSTVARIESGQYESLSDEMIGLLFDAVEGAGADLEVLAAELEDTFGTPYLAEAYLRWRRMKRKAEGDRVEWPSIEHIEHQMLLGQAPMAAFAREVSGTVEKFCTQFCVQAPTLTRYIEGRSGGKELPYYMPPAAVVEALTDAGYDERDDLFVMQREWLDGKQ